jgi:hypothetical protein
MSDPGKEQNREREQQKEIEWVGKLVAPALDPIEYARHHTSVFQSVRHDLTEVLAPPKAVKKKMAQRSEILHCVQDDSAWVSC